jgi:hypothetical protein
VKAPPPCDRCGINPGIFAWVARSPDVAQVRAEIRLCGPCLEPLKAFFANGKNKQPKKAPPPPAPVPTSPPPPSEPSPSSAADAVPIRRASKKPS